MIAMFSYARATRSAFTKCDTASGAAFNCASESKAVLRSLSSDRGTAFNGVDSSAAACKWSRNRAAAISSVSRNGTMFNVICESAPALHCASASGAACRFVS